MVIMAELAKPLSWASPSGGMVDVFLACDIAAEREAWQKEIDKRELWVNKIRTGEYVSKGVLMELAKHHDKQEAEWQAALDGEHRRADAAVSALDKAEKVGNKWCAAAMKRQEAYSAVKERADKAERTLSEKVSAAEARIKELEEGVHEIAEEVLGCSAPCSLDVRAKCKELEAKAGISQDASQRLKK